jgi:hypothetical protein
MMACGERKTFAIFSNRPYNYFEGVRSYDAPRGRHQSMTIRGCEHRRQPSDALATIHDWAYLARQVAGVGPKTVLRNELA